MKIFYRFNFAAFVLLANSAWLVAQNPSQSPVRPPVQEIIHRFADAESKNAAARNNYTFTQDLDIRTIGAAGSITGQFRRTSDIVYDDRGQRIEKITYFPMSTLVELQISQEDLQDLAGVQPFALTLEDLPKYQVDYVGEERIDELNTYVFEVKPKQIRKGERYFQGRVWVDNVDLQIVKAAGQAVPEVGDQKFPHFESYRENIDERFWFPTYVHVDDVLEFKRNSVHMQMTVRYTNYKKFGGYIKITEGGDAAPEEDTKKPAATDPNKPELKRKPPAKPEPTKKPPE
jgi:hypothetical protein